MVILGAGTDILRGVSVLAGGYGAWPQLARRVEQRAAQVLQVAQAVAGHGQAAPAAGGAIENGPHEGEAGGLAGEAADDLGAAAGLAEGPLDEVGVPDAMVVPGGEPQVSGEAFMVGKQAFHRRRVGRCVLACHLGDPVVRELGEPGAGLGLQLAGIEDGPEGVLDLSLHPGRDLRDDVPAPVDQASLAQRPGEGLLDRGDQARRPVADDQQRGGQAAVLEILQEVVPCVGGLAAARGQADEGGLAVGGDAPGGQHRLGRGAGVHPEERGVQIQVVQRDLIEAAPGPGLVLVLDLLAHRRHRGLGDRGLVAGSLGERGFHVADRQAAHKRGDH